jgi:hypothetical protein
MAVNFQTIARSLKQQVLSLNQLSPKITLIMKLTNIVSTAILASTALSLPKTGLGKEK